jgi:hypothetical protein
MPPFHGCTKLIKNFGRPAKTFFMVDVLMTFKECQSYERQKQKKINVAGRSVSAFLNRPLNPSN